MGFIWASESKQHVLLVNSITDLSLLIMNLTKTKRKMILKRTTLNLNELL